MSKEIMELMYRSPYAKENIKFDYLENPLVIYDLGDENVSVTGGIDVSSRVWGDTVIPVVARKNIDNIYSSFNISISSNFRGGAEITTSTINEIALVGYSSIETEYTFTKTRDRSKCYIEFGGLKFDLPLASTKSKVEVFTDQLVKNDKSKIKIILTGNKVGSSDYHDGILTIYSIRAILR